MRQTKRKAVKAGPLLWLTVAAGFLASLILYSKLPDQMPMHWNIAGEVDRYGSRLEGAFFLPAFNAALLLLLVWAPAIDPRRESYEKFKKFYRLIMWAIVLFMSILHGLILAWSLGMKISIALFVKAGVGLLFMILGNYMGKVKSNWFVGIKNPWTLESEEVWNKTHRLAGPLMFSAGLLILIMAFIDKDFTFWLVISLAMASALIPNIYSFLLFRKISNGGKI
ncbi:MAG: SdpI family protein [Anaerovoracaceae bacterium]